MTSVLAAIGLPELIAGIMVVALNAYVLMGGADFGGGVWDLLASGPRRAEQRALIAKTIAPIWEANHVWLIVVVVTLFTAFPVAYGTIGTVLHLPLALMLIGIVLRGSAFVFRSSGTGRNERWRWGRVFAFSSTIPPVLLGVVIGALATGDVGEAAARVATGSFYDVYVAPWLAPFPIAVGLMALALFAFLAAVYLTVEAGDEPVGEDFRRRAIATAVVAFVLAFGALALSQREVPPVRTGLTAAPWGWALHVLAGAAAVTALVSLWRRKYRVARLSAAAQVSLILWGWALAQYPFVIPSTLTIRQAAAPAVTLKLLLVGLAIGSAVLIPSLVYLLRTFARRA
jgi:cytochrome d ubiquinol oxidase subunit II